MEGNVYLPLSRLQSAGYLTVVFQQSVRHHLSLNRLFERQPRPVTDPGFGSYWTVNLAAPPGTKRPRKRGRPNKGSQDDPTTMLPKKRGRPRKSLQGNIPIGLPPFTTLALSADRTLKKCKISAMRTGGDTYQEEDEDELMEYEDRPFSEDDCESEEDSQFRIINGSILSTATSPRRIQSHCKRSLGITTNASRIPADNSETAETIIDRLQIEMAGLKRQSADAVSITERMSDQLMEAQAEASRAKAALKALENMLEEEARKRREAERIADEEARMRRAAEEALRSLRKDWLPAVKV